MLQIKVGQLTVEFKTRDMNLSLWNNAATFSLMYQEDLAPLRFQLKCCFLLDLQMCTSRFVNTTNQNAIAGSLFCLRVIKVKQCNLSVMHYKIDSSFVLVSLVLTRNRGKFVAFCPFCPNHKTVKTRMAELSSLNIYVYYQTMKTLSRSKFQLSLKSS